MGRSPAAVPRVRATRTLHFSKGAFSIGYAARLLPETSERRDPRPETQTQSTVVTLAVVARAAQTRTRTAVDTLEHTRPVDTLKRLGRLLAY